MPMWFTTTEEVLRKFGGGRMVWSLVGRALPWVVGGALGYLAGHPHGNHAGRKRHFKAEVAIDPETGEIIDVKRIRKRKVKRLPKYAQQALKNQAELTEKLSDFIEVLMFKMLAEKTK